VNLDHLKNVVYRNRSGLAEVLPTADALMAYVSWVNARLLERYVTPCLRDKALQKSMTDPLVISHDIDNKWAEDPRWLQAYVSRQSKKPSETPSLENEPTTSTTRGGQQRVTPVMRRALWNRDFGERTAVGPCCVCKGEILMTNFDAGHIKAAAKGGVTELSNLAPVCRPCNLGMGTMDMNEFRNIYYNTTTSNSNSNTITAYK
jgi:5-methylcytosine-specific restriction endonuclease McrA